MVDEVLRENFPTSAENLARGKKHTRSSSGRAGQGFAWHAHCDKRNNYGNFWRLAETGSIGVCRDAGASPLETAGAAALEFSHFLRRLPNDSYVRFDIEY